MTKKNGRPCKKCGTSDWNKNGRCKECRRRYDRTPERRAKKKAYDQNPERKAYSLTYSQKPEVKARNKAYNQTPERKAYNQTYNQKQEVKAKRRAYRQKPEVKAKARAYRQKPEVQAKARAYSQKPETKARRKENRQTLERMATNATRRANYKAKKLGIAGKIKAKDWIYLQEKYKYTCLCCGTSDEPMTLDHVIPPKKGGDNLISNVQPLCLSCNRKKEQKSTDYRNGRIAKEAMAAAKGRE